METRAYLLALVLLSAVAGCGEEADELGGTWEGEYSLRSKAVCADVVEGHSLPQTAGTMRLELTVDSGAVFGTARLGDVVVLPYEDGRLADCAVEEGEHEYAVVGARIVNPEWDAQLDLRLPGERGIEFVVMARSDGTRMTVALDDPRGREGEATLTRR